MFVDKSKFNDYTIDFGDTKVIWLHFTPYVVPEEMTLQEEMYLLASQQTLFCGNISVDNILKSQFENYEEIVRKKRKTLLKVDPTSQKKKLISDTLKEAKKIYEVVNEFLENTELINESAAFNTSVTIFKRLYPSIKACRFLIKYGYFFESYAIQRQVLEQVAFAYHVFYTTKIEEVADPPKCIAELKKFYKEAGSMYGLLSKRTHISLDQMGLYFKHNKTGGESVLTYTSLEYSLQTLYDFLIVLDIYCSTLECCFARYFKDENKKLLYVTEKRVLKKQRPTKKLVNEYAKKYMQLVG